MDKIRILRSFCGHKCFTGSGRMATWSVQRLLHQQNRVYKNAQPQQDETQNSMDADSLNISDSCVKQLKKLTTGEEESYLRILVEGGGCSGFQYKFELEQSCKEDDKVFHSDGVKVIIDVDSLDFVKGAIVEYHEELIRSSFRIIDNPKAEQGCSCGASFSLKL